MVEMPVAQKIRTGLFLAALAAAVGTLAAQQVWAELSIEVIPATPAPLAPFSIRVSKTFGDPSQQHHLTTWQYEDGQIRIKIFLKDLREPGTLWPPVMTEESSTVDLPGLLPGKHTARAWLCMIPWWSSDPKDCTLLDSGELAFNIDLSACAWSQVRRRYAEILANADPTLRRARDGLRRAGWPGEICVHLAYAVMPAAGSLVERDAVVRWAAWPLVWPLVVVGTQCENR